jgi:hypothetical protein
MDEWLPRTWDIESGAIFHLSHSQTRVLSAVNTLLTLENRPSGTKVRGRLPGTLEVRVADDIPEIADTPKAALELFIRELETFYYTWHEKAATRNYHTWFVAQAVSLISGFGNS